LKSMRRIIMHRLYWLIATVGIMAVVVSCAGNAGNLSPAAPAVSRDDPLRVEYRHEVQVLADVLSVHDDGENVTSLAELQDAAISRLEEMGGDDATDALYRMVIDDESKRQQRLNALCALGRMGTDAAVARIVAFRQHIREREKVFRFAPTEGALGFWTVPPPRNAIIEKAPDGTFWAVFMWDKYGTHSETRWLTSSVDGKHWKDPVAVSLIQFDEDAFRDAVRAGRAKAYEIGYDDDKDGLWNVEEYLLTTQVFLGDREAKAQSLDPKNPDTDGDGEIDGLDPCPLTPAQKETDDAIAIRQAVFEAFFATCNSREIIYMICEEGAAQQEYYGYPGVVLPTTKAVRGRNNVTLYFERVLEGEWAPVSVECSVDLLCSRSYYVTVTKVKGIWVVESFDESPY